MTNLTVASVFVHGERKMYSADWVAKLHSMAARNTTRTLRHVCLTDAPEEIPDWIEAIDIREFWGPLKAKKVKGWWAKIKLFDMSIWKDGERILFIDLDSLIMQSIDPFLHRYRNVPLLMAPHTSPNFNPAGTVRKGSSTVMLWVNGFGREVYDSFTFETTTRYHGDQDLISDVGKEIKTFDPAFIQRIPRSPDKLPKKKVVFVACVTTKNHIASEERTWVKEIWHE